MSEATYIWGGRAYPVRPEIAAAEIERIIAERGVCEPEMLVEAARPKGHPLHGVFTWTDKIAAKKWRVHEARNLIRSVHVEIVSGDDTIQAPAYVSVGRVKETQDRGKGYRQVSVVMADDDFAEEALRDALTRLQAVRNRYTSLAALRPVWDAIDETASLVGGE